MREISPSTTLTSDEMLPHYPPEIRQLINRIRSEKCAGRRPRPSSSLIDSSQILDQQTRSSIIDQAAKLVDENLAGRSDMCVQFAHLVKRALEQFDVMSRVALGQAIYFKNGVKIFQWEHAWVRLPNEVIDANVDVLNENPMVPSAVKIRPYWGSLSGIPSDRKLIVDPRTTFEVDSDVDEIWWPDMLSWTAKWKASNRSSVDTS